MSPLTIVPSVILAEEIDPSTIFDPPSPFNLLPSPTNAVAVIVPEIIALLAVIAFNELSPVTFKLVKVDVPDVVNVLKFVTPETSKLFNIPTLVKLELTTLLASVVPVKVFDAEVIVISLLPSNGTPLIFFVAAIFEAVEALPVKFPVTSPVRFPVTLPIKLPVKLFAPTELNPVTLVNVPPAANEVDPNVMGDCTSVPITNPKLYLASEALIAPVPPFVTSIVVPLQVPLVIVPTVAKLASEVNVVFVVAVILPAVEAVVALPKKFAAVTSLLNVFAPAIV